MLFWTNFDSLPLSHISGPPKVCRTSRTPKFLVVHAYIHVFTGGLLVRRGFCSGVCLEGFVRGGFCLSPLLSEYIHYNRKLNITFNFRFHMYMYEFFLKCHVTCSWTPPLERDVLYGRPPSYSCHKLSDLLGPSTPRA